MEIRVETSKRTGVVVVVGVGCHDSTRGVTWKAVSVSVYICLCVYNRKRGARHRHMYKMVCW